MGRLLKELSSWEPEITKLELQLRIELMPLHTHPLNPDTAALRPHGGHTCGPWLLPTGRAVAPDRGVPWREKAKQ